MSFSCKILNVLCEGQTEELFVREVLKPHLSDFGIIVKQRLIVTNNKRGSQGGLVSYLQLKNDLLRWMSEVNDCSSEQHFFTTMIDFYALPQSFPDFEEATRMTDKYLAVSKIEEAISRDVNCRCFVPYIQLHEFEALVFCGLDELQKHYPICQRQIASLNDVLIDYNGNPELINNSRHTAPSKRIMNAVNNRYNYNKPKTGAAVAKAVGVEVLRNMCPHFGEWLCKLETLR